MFYELIGLKGCYDFFRKHAEKSFSSNPPETKIVNRKTSNPFVKLVAVNNDPFKPEREGSYFATAMLDAYFSCLEHVLVLLLPFVDYDPNNDNLIEFIGNLWTEKYKRIFNVSEDTKAKYFYDKLIGIKEEFRNPLSHGFIEKHGESLYFYSMAGAVSVHLSKFKNSIHYSSYPFKSISFGEICNIFDEFDDYLMNGEIKMGLRYIMSGLDVHFDRDSVAEYKKSIRSDELFDKMIDKRICFEDMYINMDW